MALYLECSTCRNLPAKVTEILDNTNYWNWGRQQAATDRYLVYQDMLGMFTDYVPKFVRQFANVGEVMKGAFRDYIKAVKDKSFPAEENTYKIDDEIINKLY